MGLPWVAQMVKNLPALQETQVLSLGVEDPLEEGMATHSSILAWRIEPGARQSRGSQRVRHDWHFHPFDAGNRHKEMRPKETANPEYLSVTLDGEQAVLEELDRLGVGGMRGKRTWAWTWANPGDRRDREAGLAAPTGSRESGWRSDCTWGECSEPAELPEARVLASPRPPCLQRWGRAFPPGIGRALPTGGFYDLFQGHRKDKWREKGSVASLLLPWSQTSVA